MPNTDKPIYGFIGQFEHSVDGKNRVVLPSTIREKLDPDDRLVLTIWFDGCLKMFPSYEAFEQFVSQAARGGPTAQVRKLRRKLIGQAREVSVDSQGRLVLPKDLKDEAGIDNSVTVVGDFETVELWSPERWDAQLEDVNLEDAAQAIFEGDT